MKPSQEQLLCYLLTAAVVVQLCVTVGLWLPSRLYPLAPVFSWLPALPAAANPLLLGSLILAVVAFGISNHRAAGIVFLVIAAISIGLDLNRLQPWMYQFVLLMGVCLLIPNRQKASYWRWIFGAGYIWSGLLKLNPFFLSQGIGWLLSPFIVLHPDATFTQWIGMTVAFSEVAVGCALLFRSTAKWGALVGMAMHVLILIAIGPFGLHWNSAVWPWNIFMIVALGILVLSRAELLPLWPMLRRGYGLSLLVLVGALPALSVFGLWDTYLSSGLYTGNTDQATIILSNESIALLPQQVMVQTGVVPGQGHMINLLQWSLDDTNAPSYPQEWTYVSVLREFCLGYGITDARLYVTNQWTPLGNGETWVYSCGDMR